MEVSTKLRRIGIRIAALAGALVALTLFINLSWFDEELHPDLARLMPPQPVSMEGNAYPLVYGFLAADDRDPRAAGMAVIEILRERFAAGERATLSDQEMDEVLGNPAPAEVWNELFPSNDCNSRFELDCADRLIDEVGQAGSDNARLGVLLDRYKTMVAIRRFEEHQEFDAYTPIPAYGPLLSIAKIRLAMSFNAGPTAQFLDDIGDDIRFWKLMLRDGQSLIAKMIALAGLRNDTQFLSALLRQRNLSATEIATISNILTPLSEDERDIGETFLAESRIAMLSDKSLGVLLQGTPAITELALQQNATLNEYYFSTTLPLRLRSALSAHEYFEQRGFEPLTYDVRILPPPLYNLGGKFVLKGMAAEIGLTGYISRVHDIDGRIALVLLQAEILANPERNIDSVVAASRYRNPYTLAPMKYDPAAARIGFECLGNPSDTCAVQLDRPKLR
jgi:hypothetical protein